MEIKTSLPEVNRKMKHALFESRIKGTLPFRFFLPDDIEPSEKLPIIFHVHGMGAVGTDNQSQLRYGPREILNYIKMRNMRLILIAPQSPEKWVNVDYTLPCAHKMARTPTDSMRMLLELIDKSIDILPVDTGRIYLAGASMGGFACWELLQRKGKLFTAALILCGGGDPTFAKKMKHIPIWCIHGEKDGAVPVIRSRIMRDALMALKGNIILTEHPEANHDVWTETYSNPAYFDWLFSQNKHRRT